MAGEIVYADIHNFNFPSEPHSSRLLHPSQQLSAPQCLCWYRITLGVGCVVILILLTAVITLMAVGRCTGTDDFQSLVRNRLCNQQWGNSSVNSTCRLCPAHWRLHGDKCYWVSTDTKSWNKSQDDCSSRNSQLLVIKDEEEMDFFKQQLEQSKSYWIGLFLSFPEKKWIWVTGAEIGRNLFQEPKDAGGNDCGLIKKNILSEKCSTEFNWVCQQDSVLL